MVVEQQIDDEKTNFRWVNNVLVLGVPDLSLTPYGKHSDEKSLRMKASLCAYC